MEIIGTMLSADDVITEIDEILIKANGEFLENIANTILVNKIKCVGYNKFEIVKVVDTTKN